MTSADPAAQRISAGWRATLPKDFMASIVVFLVALPLCMGIAIASGVPSSAGLITGIVGGIIVGSIAGAPLQVSGPAAGLSVIVWQFVQEHGYPALGVVVLVAGLAQVLAGALRLGQWFRAVSPAVIHGMLAGIGILIFASQFHVMVDDKPYGSGIENLMYIPMAVWKGLFPPDGSVHFQAAVTGILALATLILWKPLAPRRLRVLPAPLIAVLVATIFAMACQFGIRRIELNSNILADVEMLDFSALFANLTNGTLILAGLAMAMVASAETLLCANAVDQLHDGPRTKYDRELAAQGVGNMICGLFGGLPMTGVIVRSSANVEAGGKTRASAVMHGVWLLIFVAALPFVLRFIPTAALAAVLVYTGYKLVNPTTIRKLATTSKGELLIYIATVGTIVTTDLLTGVVTGVVLSLIKLLYVVSRLDIRLDDNEAENVTRLRLRGSATVIRLPMLANILEDVRPSTELHVDFEQLDYIDHACLELLINWEKQHDATGGRLVIDWDSLTARFQTPKPAIQRQSRLDSDGNRDVVRPQIEEEFVTLH